MADPDFVAIHWSFILRYRRYKALFTFNLYAHIDQVLVVSLLFAKKTNVVFVWGLFTQNPIAEN